MQLGSEALSARLARQRIDRAVLREQQHNSKSADAGYPPLPFGGSIQAAMKAQDREAIRAILAARDSEAETSTTVVNVSGNVAHGHEGADPSAHQYSGGMLRTSSTGRIVKRSMPRSQIQPEVEVTTEHFSCPICYEDIPPRGGLRLMCGHQWCRSCAKRYVEGKSNDAMILSSLLPCPAQGCAGRMTHAELEELVGAAAKAALDRRALDAAVSSNPNMHRCMTADCSYAAFWSGAKDGVPRFACPQCGHSRCLQCDASPFHESVNCIEHAASQAELDAELITAAEKKRYEPGEQLTLMKIRQAKWNRKLSRAALKRLEDEAKSEAALKQETRCPSCKVVITKNGGCNHMTCRCGFEFCWLCRGAYPKVCDTGTCLLKKSIMAHT